MISTIVGELKPVSIQGEGSARHLTLSGPAPMVAMAQTRLKDMQDVVSRAAGGPMRLSFDIVGEAPVASGNEATPGAAAPPQANLMEHPLVKEAIELFGARVVGVYDRKRREPEQSP